GFAVWNQREEPTPTPVTSVDAPQEAPTRPDVRAGNPSVAPTTLVETAAPAAPAAEDIPAPADLVEATPHSGARELPAKRPKRRRKPTPKPRATPPAPEPSTPAPAPPEPSALDLEDGIDWTVPDFPEDELRAPPPGPTGSPEAPPRNPVVIDEVPAEGPRSP
ncbi:MAG: hypothetical protein AAF997_17150, partial [Myxococcota bacterium]